MILIAPRKLAGVAAAAEEADSLNSAIVGVQVEVVDGLNLAKAEGDR